MSKKTYASYTSISEKILKHRKGIDILSSEEIRKSGVDIERIQETFDLTNKSNPQYSRYEKWGKFLKNKYGGKEVVEPQGNKWVEIDFLD